MTKLSIDHFIGKLVAASIGHCDVISGLRRPLADSFAKYRYSEIFCIIYQIAHSGYFIAMFVGARQPSTASSALLIHQGKRLARFVNRHIYYFSSGCKKCDKRLNSLNIVYWTTKSPFKTANIKSNLLSIACNSCSLDD